jgi:hypothetical protein
MAKRAREQAVREKREEKQAKKAADRAARNAPPTEGENVTDVELEVEPGDEETAA